MWTHLFFSVVAGKLLSVSILQGPSVQTNTKRAIIANPGLTFNPGSFFSF